MKQLNIFLALFFSLLVVGACSDNKSKKNVAEDVFYVEAGFDKASFHDNYRIPTPIDLFIIIKNSEMYFQSEILNDPSKRINYNTKVKRAVNFGIYTTDLAYCSVYGDFQQSLMYFSVAKSIAIELGLYEGYGEEMAFRINNNLNNIDSLIDISTDSYFQATNFLSSQGMPDIMALVMAGCWLESIYISVESVEKFSEDNILVERIADQHLLLENLIELFKASNNSGNLSEMLNTLMELQEEYDPLYFNSDDVLITKHQYVDIVNKIREVRNELVR